MIVNPQRPTVTAGRTLLNCSERQFAAFSAETSAAPRPGLIEEIMPQLEARLEVVGGLYSVHQGENEVVVKNPTRAGALRTWWDEYGRALALKHRKEVGAWKGMPGPGRRPGKVYTTVTKAQRNSAREAARDLLLQVWQDARVVLASQHPSTEILLRLAEDRELPRQHCLQRVSAKRACLEAMRVVYDISGQFPAWGTLISGTGEQDDEQLQEMINRAYLYYLQGANAAAMMAHACLASALLLSNLQAQDLADQLRAVLKAHDITSIQALRDLYLKADPTK